MSRQPTTQQRFEEARVAKQVQAALLPHVCEDCQGARIRARHRMSQGIGGDLYDFIPRDDGTYCIIVGDVTGHEVFSAIVMSLIVGAVRSVGPTASSPARIVGLVNDLLCRLNDELRTQTLMCSLFCGIVRPREEIMTYVNAGHPAGIILRRDGSVEDLASTERVLGVSRKLDRPVANLDLRGIERLLLYTDGMTERRDALHKPVGVAPLVEVLKACRDRPLEETLDRLFERVHSVSDEGPRDDMTAVLAEFTHDTDTKRRGRRKARAS